MARNPYYHNGKYSPNKARREAQRKYANGTPEYRKEIDEIGFVVWAVVIGICVIIFVLIAIFKGGDSAVDWIKWIKHSTQQRFTPIAGLALAILSLWRIIWWKQFYLSKKIRSFVLVSDCSSNWCKPRHVQAPSPFGLGVIANFSPRYRTNLFVRF